MKIEMWLTSEDLATLKGADLKVLILLFQLSRDGRVTVDRTMKDRLVEDLGLKENTVNGCVSRLSRMGYMTREKGTRVYVFN